MFKKKPTGPTTEDVTDSIEPWEMLDDAGIATHTARIRARDPRRALTAFARRVDQDTLACFNKGGDGKSKAVVVLRHVDDPAQTQEHRYPGFSAWFDDAPRGRAAVEDERPLRHRLPGRRACRDAEQLCQKLAVPDLIETEPAGLEGLAAIASASKGPMPALVRPRPAAGRAASRRRRSRHQSRRSRRPP